jgi:hypothetical protein
MLIGGQFATDERLLPTFNLSTEVLHVSRSREWFVCMSLNCALYNAITMDSG